MSRLGVVVLSSVVLFLVGCGGSTTVSSSEAVMPSASSQAGSSLPDEASDDSAQETRSTAEIVSSDATPSSETASLTATPNQASVVPPANAKPQKLESAIYQGATQNAANPKSLTIGSLSINQAPVIPVGIEANGDMEVPDALSVGWYSFGSAPGDAGSTVLAAHIAESGVDGVFRYLDTVNVGSVVSVELEDGSVKQYEITERQQYNKTQLPFDDIFRRSGEEQLVLITCGGDFNPSVRSYEDNVVAYAKAIS